MNKGTLGTPRGNFSPPRADLRNSGIVGGLEYWNAAGQATAGALSAVTTSTSTLRLMPIPAFSRAMRITGVGVESTAGGAGSVTRVGIYRSRDAAESAPRDLLFDSGSLSTVGATAHAIACAIAVTPHYIYWGAVLTGVAAPTLRGTVIANSIVIGHGAGFGATCFNHLTRTYVFAALPERLENNTASIVPASASIPFMFYRLDLPQGRVE